MTIKIEDASEPKQFVVGKNSEYSRVGQRGEISLKAPSIDCRNIKYLYICIINLLILR